MTNKNDWVLSASLISFISHAESSGKKPQGEDAVSVVHCEGSAVVDKENLRWRLVVWQDNLLSIQATIWRSRGYSKCFPCPSLSRSQMYVYEHL